ncbi:MAG: sulfurtransferase [Candidatus Rokubacteria bacterium]|nr:sulfurtransferase [Candidatus Rokubacteria bacterium]
MSDPRETILVETDWLADRLTDPAIRIVDIRGTIRPPDAPKPWYAANREAYREAHVPGAVFVDWLEEIVDGGAPVPMAVATPEQLKTLMEGLGIGDEHLVVVYDDSAHIAPRLWWVLNYYGHDAVRVLNGGWTKWVAEERPVTAEVPKHPISTFTPHIRPEWRVGSREVRAALGDPAVCLVDCRSPKEFRGELGRGERKGRIPGAVNVPIAAALEGPHKTWKSGAEIRRLYKAAGVRREHQIITYCNAGVSASVGLLALRLAGYPKAANFAGSWYEWERDPANPTETG